MPSGRPILRVTHGRVTSSNPVRAAMSTTTRPSTINYVGHVVLTLLVHEEDDPYVSRCPELGTASCGDTIDEALHNIREATQLYLNSIEAAGERERIFRKREIQIFLGPSHEKGPAHVTANTAETVGFLVHEVSGAAERHGSPAAAV